jgi:hypothetical protein
VALPCCHDEADDSTGRNVNEQQQQQQEVYFYNTATKSIRWTLPEELQQLLETQDNEAAAAAAAAADAPDKAAGAAATAAAPAAAVKAVLSPTAYQALLDLQEDRVMPNLSAIKAGKQVTHVNLPGCTAREGCTAVDQYCLGLYCQECCDACHGILQLLIRSTSKLTRLLGYADSLELCHFQPYSFALSWSLGPVPGHHTQWGLQGSR